MSVTATQIIESAMSVLSVLDPGVGASTSEKNDGLDRLNAMLDSWSLDRLCVPASTHESFPLTSAKSQYTFGPSGDMNGARPLQIQAAASIVPTPSGKTAAIPLEVRSIAEYNSIAVRGTAGTPRVLHCEYRIPLAEVILWPVPNSSSLQLEVWYWAALEFFPDLTTGLTLYPGYQRAIAYNLAVEIASDCGVAVPASVAQIAHDSLGAIRGINAQPDRVSPSPIEQ